MPFLALIGASGKEHPKVLGMLSQDEIADEIKNLTIDANPLNVKQKGFVRAVIHESRVIGGTEQPDLVDDAASVSGEPVRTTN